MIVQGPAPSHNYTEPGPVLNIAELLTSLGVLREYESPRIWTSLPRPWVRMLGVAARPVLALRPRHDPNEGNSHRPQPGRGHGVGALRSPMSMNLETQKVRWRRRPELGPRTLLEHTSGHHD
jgi:hypothetical protein